MIMAWQKQGAGSLPCYTFAGMLRDCQDVIVARQVAAMCGQSHQQIPLGEEFLTRFPDYAERAVYLTDGCCDVSRAPDVYWNTRARQIAPVRMTGNYGGELLRGIRTFKPAEPLPGLFAADLDSYFSQTAQIYSEQIRGNPISFAMFKQAPWNHRGMLALEQTQVSLRSPFWDNEFVRTVFRAPSSALVTSEASIRLIADGNRDLLRVPTDRGLLGEQGRVSRAASQVFFEFLFKAEYAYDMGMPQWLARADHVFRVFHFERLFLGRHKISHFRSWYGDPLAPYVREILLDPRSLGRPYVQRKRLEEVVEGHLAGRRNYTTEIHKLLTLELLHRLFLGTPGTANLSERPGVSMAASAAH
jgi:asparagine synthase (glutamine-hydrolysing)